MDKRLAKIVANDMLISKKAGRWVENVSFQKKLKEDFLKNPDFDEAVDNIGHVDDFMILLSEDIGKLPKRVQKFVNAYCDYIGNGNVYQNSLGKYLEEVLDIEDYYNGFSYTGYGEYGNSEIDILELLKKNLYLLDVKEDIDTIINSISNVQVDDDIEKAQKEKILRTVQIKGNKLIKTCNDFKMLVDTELLSSNVEEVDLPFVYVLNTKTRKPLKQDGADATRIEEVAKFKNDDDAMKLVDKGGVDFVSIDCNDEKDYRKLLDYLKK